MKVAIRYSVKYHNASGSIPSYTITADTSDTRKFWNITSADITNIFSNLENISFGIDHRCFSKILGNNVYVTVSGSDVNWTNSSVYILKFTISGNSLNLTGVYAGGGPTTSMIVDTDGNLITSVLSNEIEDINTTRLISKNINTSTNELS